MVDAETNGVRLHYELMGAGDAVCLYSSPGVPRWS